MPEDSESAGARDRRAGVPEDSESAGARERRELEGQRSSEIGSLASLAQTDEFARSGGLARSCDLTDVFGSVERRTGPASRLGRLFWNGDSIQVAGKMNGASWQAVGI
ncbi:hypothetical protein B1748_21325 [Paenibacillus sp. MY03]|nr:hypothetical protein B1748_21325 [Paenibacillus sp. MY03]